MNNSNKEYYRLKDDFVDAEMEYITEIYTNEKNYPVRWEDGEFPLSFVIGFRNDLNNDKEPLHNVWNYHVYEPWDYNDAKFGVDTKKRVRGCAYMEEKFNEKLDLLNMKITGRNDSVAEGLMRYIKSQSAYYNYNLHAEITKEGEENKALLQVVVVTHEEDIKKSVYKTNNYVPITDVECYFTCGDIVEAMGFNIKAKHARIHDMKAFVEDLSINFSKCFMNDISEIAFTEQIKNDKVWEALLLHFQERLSHYVQYAAEQNGIKLNARIDIDNRF